MATRFIRVDLSDTARDFRPIAVEPGVPLLDRSNAHAKILFKWLGGMVAEPEWEAESLNFYARDDHGGRLEDIVCLPASDDDLKGPLSDDLEALQERIAKAKPETSTERAIHKTLSETFNGLLEDENRTDRDNYFFKYRDVQGRWRLVWCCGYQRVDQEPAATIICTDSECGLLFVRRPGESPKCPSCEAALATGPVKRRASPRRRVLVGLLLFLLGGALVYWLLNSNRLVATPDSWTGPVGSRVEFKVWKSGLFGGKDVGQQVVVVAADPRVLRLDPFGAAATARSPGKTLVRFYLGSKTATATVTVKAPKNPLKITIEPQPVELAVGTTARLKLVGEYEDGSTAELTDAGEWLPKNDGIVYACNGYLEGVGEGATTVTARYRATPEDEYREASANVSVANVQFKALELALHPDPVPLGRGSALRVDAVSEAGKRYSLVDSSQLKLEVSPPYIAGLHGTHVEGEHPGHARIEAALGSELSAGLDFDAEEAPGIDTLLVAPEQLDLAVGEITDLVVVSPSRDPIRVTTSDPAVVEVTGTNRLIGRSEGTAQLQVAQAGETRTVEATVTKDGIRSIEVEPGLVGVPVDHSVPVRVMGWTEGGRKIELAPDLITAEKTPLPRYGDFNARSMEIHGVRATEKSSPQSLAFRFKKHRASAPVEMVVAPLRLELTPEGPVDLPLGQAMRLAAQANYPAGYRVEALPFRVEWHSDPPSEASAGLQLRDDKVVALKAGAGPMSVWGTYFGRDSNRVVFQSVAAGPVDLQLEIDRTLRLAGEPGKVMLTGKGPRGDVELIAELAKFTSSDPQLLAIDETSGTFRALAPGEVSVTGSHAASTKPASLSLRVVDPANASLVFEPGSVQVAVDERANLELFLEAREGGKVRRARMEGPGVAYTIAQPEAVRWHPPTLVGLRPADPFDITASYYPFLSSPAVAQVEVTGEEPVAIRCVPSQASLAAGQSLPLVVEEQVSEGGPWKEIRGDAVAWQVSPRLLWSPATKSLRAAVSVPEGTSGEFELTARYGGKEATCEISTAEPGLDPGDAGVELVLDREPGGRYLPVGREQRYWIVLRKGDQQEPAADVRWPKDFENDYVRWQAPVLTAKQAGYEQWLQAEVGGRAVRFYTHTIDPFQPGQMPPPRTDQPFELVIVSDQGPAVRFPVGAEFNDFRIEARYPDGFTQMVTKKATMRTAEGASQGPVAFSKGRILGVQPGQAVVHADFDGVPTEKGLEVAVSADVDVDEIRLAPAPVSILPGETIAMDATGYKGGKSVGVITGLGGLAWKSTDNRVVGVNGPSVTGLQLGQGAVTAQLGAVASAPAEVSVVSSIDDVLAVDQEMIQMRVGESRQIGTDLAVLRGQIDFSRQCQVTPALPGVVSYVPETHSLKGVSPGVSAVTFAWGDKLATTTVQVLPGGPLEGEVVVEPAGGTLSPGQAMELRVFLVSKEGQRIDRTDSAVLSSSAPQTIMIRGNRACATAPGDAEISASLPESNLPGKAYLAVNNEPISELVVEPSQVAMSVGDLERLRILGRSATGTHELFPQPNLRVEAAGQNPEAIRIVASQDVDAVAPGNAEVAVRWLDTLSQQVPVTVTDDPMTDLTIDPSGATIHPGQALVYQVTGLRGGRRRVLGPADGVKLFVDEPEVAQVVENDLAVVGGTPGRTDVTAQLGQQQAAAVLNVTPGTGPAGTDVAGDPGGLGHHGTGTGIGHGHGGVVDHPGYGYHGHGGHWAGYGGPHRWLDGPGWVGRHGVVEGVVPPAAGIARLQFIPDVVRMGTDSPGARVRVVEVLADGTVGRDVTADPALEFTPPHDCATLERGPEGPVFRPVKPGQTRVAAKLGMLVTDPELLIQVGDAMAGMARLDVTPDPLELWTGEAGTFGSVLVVAGPGQFPVDVGYSITPTAGQNVVTMEPDGRLRGVAPGVTQVQVTTNPGGPYGGLSTTATVRVTNPDELWLEPRDVTLRAGETTPPFVVMCQSVDGRRYRVPAALDSMDVSILAPDPAAPGQFVAQSLGRTQVRALYRNRETFANVTVSGQRFVDVKATLSEGQQDFYVTLEVLAATSEGPLEYRAYAAGQVAPDVWVPAQDSGGEYRRVLLQSPSMQYGSRSSRYNLMIEARSPSDGSAQKYPFTFRLAPNIERTDPRN